MVVSFEVFFFPSVVFIPSISYLPEELEEGDTDPYFNGEFTESWFPRQHAHLEPEGDEEDRDDVHSVVRMYGEVSCVIGGIGGSEKKVQECYEEDDDDGIFLYATFFERHKH